MASAAAAAAQGGGGDSNDLAVVYRAVRSGASAEQVRAILAGGPRTRKARAEWLAAVLEYKGGPGGDETSLQAAHHRRRDGPTVGALLEHGADVRALAPDANSLAIYIAYGQVDSLRVLLRSGRHTADEKVSYYPGATFAGIAGAVYFCRPSHLCIVPPRLSVADYLTPPPQLECLDVLVREFGADVEAKDGPHGETPLHWLRWSRELSDQRRTLDALLALGADPNAVDRDGRTCIFGFRDPETLQQILARGASPNVIARNGETPLLRACHNLNGALVSLLLPLTSTETRRSVCGGYSALDWMLYYASANPAPWKQRAIEELLSSRVPVHPDNAATALPFAARLAERLAAQAARRNRSGAMQWRAHEDLAGLALDFQELREAKARVEERERRVAELEAELRRRGGDDGAGEEEGDEEGEEKEGESNGGDK